MLQKENEAVRLSHIKLVQDQNSSKKPMFVLHGLLGSKVNWKGICGNKKILTQRDCYLLEMRNHSTSDHHQEHNYQVMSDDVIRFAD